MPLSSSTSCRALKHTRAVQIEAFARNDGPWDTDAHITDIKTRDTNPASGTRLTGTPGHSLWLRFAVDTQLIVVDAEAVAEAIAYPESELAQILPDDVIPSFAADVLDICGGASVERQSHQAFQFDHRHALRSDGATVAQYYPRWIVSPLGISEFG